MKINRFYRPLFQMVFFMVLVIFVYLAAVAFMAPEDFNEMVVWDMYIDGDWVGQAADNNPYRVVHAPLHKGEELSMITTLPDFGDVQFPAIQLRVQYCAMQMYLDGDYYKGYDIPNLRTGKYIGKKNLLVSIPDGSAGKTMELKFYPQAESVPVPVYNIIINQEQSIRHVFLQVAFFPIAIGAFLLILGGIMLLISLLFGIVHRELLYHALSSVLMLIMGIMLHTYFGITAIYWDRMPESELFYYACMIYVLISSIWSGRIKDKLYRFIHRTILALYGAYALLRFLFHLAGLVWINEYFGVHMLACFLLLFPVMLDEIKYRSTGQEWYDPSWRLQMLGLKLTDLFLLVCFTCAECSKHIYSDFDNVLSFVEIITITVGLLTFAICQIVNFLRFSADSFRRNEELDDLTRVAFEDVMTRLPNRASMSRQVNIYEKEQEDYAIISIDVNGLKHINDTYGHVEGDRLLKGFAEVLRDALGRNGFCCRTGGDEFLVLMPEDMHVAESFIPQVMNILEEKNEREIHKWKYMASFGIAMRTEAETFHEAYLLADQRMYDDKRKKKEEQSGEK